MTYQFISFRPRMDLPGAEKKKHEGILADAFEHVPVARNTRPGTAILAPAVEKLIDFGMYIYRVHSHMDHTAMWINPTDFTIIAPCYRAFSSTKLRSQFASVNHKRILTYYHIMIP